MAKKTSSKSQSLSEKSLGTWDSTGDLKTSLGSDSRSAFNALNALRATWDDKESIALMKNNEGMNQEYQSRINDGRLATLAWERTARVVSNIPTGQVRSISKADAGQSRLMDLVLWRYIVPNANTQREHLIKLRLWMYHASIYGSSPMLRFWKVSDDYVGPDCYLVPIRNFFPQPGKTSVEAMQWCMIMTVVSVADLRSYKDDKTGSWDSQALDKVLERAKEGGSSVATRSAQYTTLGERLNYKNAQAGKGDFAEVTLVTKYEAGADGHWITFCPDFDNEIIRDVPNQHKDNEIPVTMLDSFPMLDSIIGQGDFERGLSLQFAANSLVNLYFDSVKMKLFPPLIVNPNEAYMSSLEWQPGAVWKVKSPNAISEFGFNPQGLNTFQSTYSVINAAMQNQFGSTSTEVNAEQASDPTFGKTPDAIKMMGQRQSARDGWSTFLVENALGRLYEGFINMMATLSKDGKDAIFHVFDAEARELAADPSTKDVTELSDSKQHAKVTIGNGKLKGEYRFMIDPNSTQKEDQKEAFQNLMQFFQVLPNLGDVLQEEGHRINWPWFIFQMVKSSGVDGATENLILPEDQAAQKKQQQVQAKQSELTTMAYKDLPEPMKRIAERERWGTDATEAALMIAQQDPSQADSFAGMSPQEQKLAIDRAKLEIANRKQSLSEQQAPVTVNHPLVQQMDHHSGYALDPMVQKVMESALEGMGQPQPQQAQPQPQQQQPQPTQGGM